MITIGTIVGRYYRVTDLIGTGGMAHVYRAVHLSTHKVVAIKVLKDEFRNDAEFLRRFERESRAVLHLSHDNIVRAFDVGETDGLPYIVLEYVDGKTLKEIIVENGLCRLASPLRLSFRCWMRWAPHTQPASSTAM
jgi:serine/threonine-protein kinase